MQKVAYCRMAPSLGALEDTPENIWGTPPYDPRKHRNEPCVFFGLYDLRDYIALWWHKGKKWVLWAGSDIRNLQAGFIFNDGKLKWLSKLLRGNWWVFHILKDTEHWVENHIERDCLADLGIQSSVCPSYLGAIPQPSYQLTGDQMHVYASCGTGRQVEYGFDVIERIAPQLPTMTFHLYGDTWETKHPNVKVHGRVPKEQMNEEIKHMHCGLRLNEFDGFSEITAKSVLMGQYPVTRITYPEIYSYQTDEHLVNVLKYVGIHTRPNLKPRNYYMKKINKFPWNKYA